MTKRMVTPIVLVILAVLLQFASHHYGSRRLHLVMLLLTYTLIADALWSLGSIIADGGTSLSAKPAYLWLFRFLAVATVAYGVWSVWLIWSTPQIYQ
jgi:hypothetical protein